MKIKEKSFFKNNKAITLIALVITIIVLLILAGVSISMLSGNNGVLQKTTKAKELSREAEIKERVNLWNTEVEIEKNTNGTISDERLNQFKSELNAIAKDEEIDWTTGKVTLANEGVLQINLSSENNKVITFYLEDLVGEYDNGVIPSQAKEGMTWQEWVNSEYNTKGFIWGIPSRAPSVGTTLVWPGGVDYSMELQDPNYDSYNGPIDEASIYLGY